MTDPIANETDARALIAGALAPDIKPVLDSASVDTLVAMASRDDDGETVWPIASLDAVVALGWEWKAARVAGDFDMGVGSGKTFSRSQVYDHCKRMASDYRNGRATVGTGTEDTGAAFESITLTSVAYEAFE